METVSFDAILPYENHQDVVEISRGDEEANVVANLEKNLTDSETEIIKNNKMPADVVIHRCQQILKSEYKMRCGLQDSIFG